jgi:hypothetical protein
MFEERLRYIYFNITSAVILAHSLGTCDGRLPTVFAVISVTERWLNRGSLKKQPITAAAECEETSEVWATKFSELLDLFFWYVTAARIQLEIYCTVNFLTAILGLK